MMRMTSASQSPDPGSPTKPPIIESLPSNQSAWWTYNKIVELVQGYHLLLATGCTFEAFLFASICKQNNNISFIGYATTEKEALELIEESKKISFFAL